MNNEAVSRAESVPDQVSDVVRAKHAGSRVVLPTARAALCHLLKLACVHTEGFGLSANRGKPKPFVMSDKHWEWRGSMPGRKTDWKALGGIRRRGGGTEGHERVWAVNSPAMIQSKFCFPLCFFYSPFLSSSNLVGRKKKKTSIFTSPLDSEVLKWREAVRACSLFRLYCQREHCCLFKQAYHFSDKVRNKVTTAVETSRQSLMDKKTQ